MPNLASERRTVQHPLLQHAQAAGWVFVPKEAALARRRGEGGLFFYKTLEGKLLELNPGLVTPENVGAVIQALEAVPPTIEGNAELLAWLRGEKSVAHPTERRQINVALLNFARPENNVFEVTEEWTYRNGPRKANRADVMFLLNGVPVAIVENKNPALKNAMEKALAQLARYHVETPEMMVAPQVFNITHLIEHFYGVTWNLDHKNVFNWKDEAGVSGFEARVKRFFEPARFLTMLRRWIVFYRRDDELKKSVLRQHQTRAVEKVVERAADPTKKTGLVWHTQGSGKTFTMITAAQLILEWKERFAHATVLLVVDRNELEGQLSGWVEALLGELSSRDIKIEPAGCKARLRELLAGDFRGLIVTMIHKFDGADKNLCTRSNVVVLVDEAHRSTGGDLGNYLLGALPNAKLIGFTGTPIDKTAYGQGTFKIFGAEDERGYLDKYSIAESIADGTTVKLRHQFVPGEMTLPADLLEKEFLALAETEGVSDIEDLNRVLDRAVRLKAFLKSDDHVEKVARFVAQHFKENVQPLGYKAFLVAVDREACALYKQALDRLLPPEWVMPIYTKNSEDGLKRPLAAKYQIDEAAEIAARKAFPKPGKGPQIFIVTDKLLTGYDAPILYCLYLDKPMRDHVLLQAMARVNRPYTDAKGRTKNCGLIVDFVGILKDLNKALAFDSDDVSGLIEGLDVLQARFIELMSGPAKAYLPARGSYDSPDAQLEHLLYGTFADEKKREAFLKLFDELEDLYEILSPAAWLHDYIQPYGWLAALHEMVTNAYGRKTSFLGNLAHKTELLVRENAAAYGLDQLSRAVDIDETTLKALREGREPDETKVFNLVKSLGREAADKGAQQPFLIPFAERAERILESMEERQTTTSAALADLEKLAEEKIAMEEARRGSKLTSNAFVLFWYLRKEGLKQPEAMAREVDALIARFPNHEVNADEYRQLKGELLKLLLKEVDGRRLISLADQLMTLPRG
jgi:type I restriction enzyme R subunit